MAYSPEQLASGDLSPDSLSVADKITSLAPAAGADPDHALCIGNAESALSSHPPDSPTGAVGPMQILPSTWAGLQKQGLVPPGADIRDPDANIKGGLAHIGYLNKKYKNTADATVAYSIGEPAAAKYLQTHNLADLPEQHIDNVANYLSSVHACHPLTGTDNWPADQAAAVAGGAHPGAQVAPNVVQGWGPPPDTGGLAPVAPAADGAWGKTKDAFTHGATEVLGGGFGAPAAGYFGNMAGTWAANTATGAAQGRAVQRAQSALDAAAKATETAERSALAKGHIAPTDVTQPGALKGYTPTEATPTEPTTEFYGVDARQREGTQHISAAQEAANARAGIATIGQSAADRAMANAPPLKMTPGTAGVSIAAPAADVDALNAQIAARQAAEAKQAAAAEQARQSSLAQVKQARLQQAAAAAAHAKATAAAAPRVSAKGNRLDSNLAGGLAAAQAEVGIGPAWEHAKSNFAKGDYLGAGLGGVTAGVNGLATLPPAVYGGAGALFGPEGIPVGTAVGRALRFAQPVLNGLDYTYNR